MHCERYLNVWKILELGVKRFTLLRFNFPLNCNYLTFQFLRFEGLLLVKADKAVQNNMLKKYKRRMLVQRCTVLMEVLKLEKFCLKYQKILLLEFGLENVFTVLCYNLFLL